MCTQEWQAAHPEGPKQPEGGFMLHGKALWPQSFLNCKSDQYDDKRKTETMALYCNNKQEDEIMEEGEANNKQEAIDSEWTVE